MANFNIDPNQMVTSTLHAIDSVLNKYVQTVYDHIASGYHSTILSLISLYLIWVGYEILFDPGRPIYSLILRRIFLLGCVYGLVFKWNIYNTLFYNIFTNEPQNLATVLAGAAGQTVDSALDNTFFSVCKLAFSFWGHGGFSTQGILFFLYGCFVFLLGIPLSLFATVLFIYSKVAMAITLALGPIFVLCLMFDSTKGYFTAWVNKLVTFALIPVVTTAILSLMMSIINTVTPNTDIQNVHFSGIVAFLFLSIAAVGMLTQVLRIASALGGGLALSSLGSAAHSALGSMGVHAGRKLLKERKDEARKDMAERRAAERHEAWKSGIQANNVNPPNN